MRLLLLKLVFYFMKHPTYLPILNVMITASFIGEEIKHDSWTRSSLSTDEDVAEIAKFKILTDPFMNHYTRYMWVTFLTTIDALIIAKKGKPSRWMYLAILVISKAT